MNLQDGGGGQARVGSEGRLHRRGGGRGGVTSRPSRRKDGRAKKKKLRRESRET